MAIKQFKLKELAANFDLKSKDIADILASKGIPGKTTMATLESAELSIVFDYLTQQNQVEDIDVYMYAPKTEKPKIEKPEKTVQPQTEKADKPAVVQPQTQSQSQSQSKQPQTQSGQSQQPQSNQSGQNQQRRERDFSNPAFNKDGKHNKNAQARITQNQQRQQQQGQNFGGQNKQIPRGTDKVGIISSDNNLKFAAGVKDESAKIVDTRTTSVDLSKYNDKLETYVPDTLSDRNRNFNSDKQQKIKQKPTSYQGGQNKYQGGQGKYQGGLGKDKYQSKDKSFERDRYGKPIDKEKIALEKLKKQQREQELEKAKKKQLSIVLPEKIIGSDLAAKLRVTSAEVIKKLFMLGVKANVNEEIDYDTAALVAMEFGAKVDKEIVMTIEDRLFDESADAEDKLVARAPVVVVMGHVDHGKTSLLDAIKHTNVTAGEAGGITQHIGAYRVETDGGKEITFLDTPGHAAFTAMRARGAKSTDIAILVVAADDGIMPQTVEAINHAKAAGVSIIVAINKMDKPQANPEQVKQGLTQYELVPEEWGGDVICVPVSAVTRQGIDELLEMILLVSEMKDLKSNPDRLAQGVVIEAKLDKGTGPVATVLVQNGTLHSGDIVIAGTAVGRVRAMRSDRGRTIKTAGPSVPVEITGLSETPNAGDTFRVVEDEKMARELVEQRKSEEKEEQFKTSSNITLEDLFTQVKSGIKELNIIIKADVQGSVEALKASLVKESNEEVKIKAIHSAVGGITESDIMLASASNAIVIGFNVRPDKTAIDTAERKGVDIRTYRVIYDCIEEMRAAMKGMLAPKFKEVLLGHAQVRQVIKVPNIGAIAGSYVQDGKISRNSQIRVVRDGIVIFEDKISSLRRFKDDVREVAQGFECGIGLEKFNDIQELDILESFVIEQITES